MSVRVSNWRKSSKSGQNSGCVEVGRVAEGAAAVRDSKDRAAGCVTATRVQWRSFVAAVKGDRFG